MMGSYNENGDLGRGRQLTPVEFAIVAPYIANSLKYHYDFAVLHDVGKGLGFKYGFEFSLAAKDEIQIAIMQVKRKLPPSVSFYEIDGRSIFDIRGPSGGFASALICYLTTPIVGE